MAGKPTRMLIHTQINTTASLSYTTELLIILMNSKSSCKKSTISNFCQRQTPKVNSFTILLSASIDATYPIIYWLVIAQLIGIYLDKGYDTKDALSKALARFS